MICLCCRRAVSDAAAAWQQQQQRTLAAMQAALEVRPTAPIRAQPFHFSSQDKLKAITPMVSVEGVPSGEHKAAASLCVVCQDAPQDCV